MKYYYDLHIHTGLSPCGDNDMTPNNIVNMSLINGLDIIAITDHNSILNVAATMEAAKETDSDLLVIGGMEVETAEEIHVVCLFENMNDLELFYDYIIKNRTGIKNKEKIFGEQLVFNSLDEVTAKEENLLVTATKAPIYDVFKKVNEIGGVAIPAHVDRSSYSIISNLGFIPDDLNLSFIELSKNITEEDALLKYPYIKKYRFVRSSDAHYLEDISENINFFELESKTSKDLIDYLKKG